MKDALLDLVKQRMLEQELAQREEENQFQRLRAERLDKEHADDRTYQRTRDTKADEIAALGRERQAKLDDVNLGVTQVNALEGGNFADLVDPSTQGFQPNASPALGLPPLPGTKVMGVSPPEMRQGKIQGVNIGGRTVRPHTAEENRAAQNRLLDEASQRRIAEQAPDDARAAAMFAETQRHNRATENQAWASSNRRVEGRPVLSGDANRLAEFDQSTGLLNRLTKELGGTGAQSQLGTMVPNFVTEFTGWGMDAKSRQATIDTVKQIIGKTLEEGVLRLEDERKYEKILPRIGDPGPVAAAKIKGLIETINTNKSRLLDSLDDAGFNVAEFRARQPPPSDESGDTTPPPPGGDAPKIGDTRSSGNETRRYDGKSWVLVPSTLPKMAPVGSHRGGR